MQILISVIINIIILAVALPLFYIYIVSRARERLERETTSKAREEIEALVKEFNNIALSRISILEDAINRADELLKKMNIDNQDNNNEVKSKNHTNNLNIKIEDIIIEYNEFGKPYLKNDLNYKFNISHSNELIVIGMDFENEIGVDIEFKKNINLESYIKILKNDEIQKLNTREDKLDKFYEIWTIKESFFKEEGKGLSIIDDDYYIDYDNCNIQYKNKMVSFKKIDYFQYKICICSKSIDSINIIEINNTMFEELLRKNGEY